MKPKNELGYLCGLDVSDSDSRLPVRLATAIHRALVLESRELTDNGKEIKLPDGRKMSPSINTIILEALQKSKRLRDRLHKMAETR